MKQINDLIVVEIPKETVRTEIIRTTLFYETKDAANHLELPSGYEYEVIGTESQMNMRQRIEVLHLAQHSDGTGLRGLLEQLDLPLNPATDLLFLKRITNQKQ